MNIIMRVGCDFRRLCAASDPSVKTLSVGTSSPDTLNRQLASTMLNPSINAPI